MSCVMHVFEWMSFTDHRKFPPEVRVKPVRYRIEHEPSCRGDCKPEEVNAIMRHYDMKSQPLPHFDPALLPRPAKWDFRMLALARLVSTWSQDPSTKVGAVIARPDNTVLSLGFNGFARGVDDDPEIYADRERKYERIVHAELNAVLVAPERPKGCTLYVWPPALRPGTCGRCAAAVIQSGVTRIVSILGESAFNERWKASYHEAYQMYMEAGLTVQVYALETFEEWTKATQDSSS